MQSIQKKEAILLVPISITQKYPHYKTLGKKLFCNVIQYDAIFRYRNSKEDTATYFLKILPNMDLVSDIYIWGAQYSFGIFAAEQNIPFIFCEEATGMMSRRNILEHIDEINPHLACLYQYVQELGLYTGKCAVAKAILYNFSAQLKNFDTGLENHINFSVVDELLSLEKVEQREIISFFTEVKELYLPLESIVLFTQPLANLRLILFEEEILLYQMTIDYFFQNRSLVIKPHPDDLIYYSKLFPDATIIKERFPSEFLPFLVDNKPKCVATIYSTAIYNLRGHYPEVFELDDRYERDFPKTHRYYMALQIAKSLQKPIYCVGTNEILMEKLANRVGISLENCDTEFREDILPEAPYIVIVDDITIQGGSVREKLQKALLNADENAVFIFTNTKLDYCWYAIEQKDFWKNILCVPIVKTLRDDAPEEDFYENLKEEQIYVYAKDLKLLKEVNAMTIKKSLPHVGIDVSKLPLTSEEEHIKMLEGILAATEQRLLYYINRVKELEQK